jgi:hypothetical protein
MIYLLFYKSSFTDQNKIFHTLLFGTLLYMVIHMVITFLDSNTLNIIKNNYLTLFITLDLFSTIYIAYGDGHINLGENTVLDKNKNEDINKTINKLKNTINNVIGNNDNDDVISFSHGTLNIGQHNTNPNLNPNINPNNNLNPNPNPNINPNINPNPNPNINPNNNLNPNPNSNANLNLNGNNLTNNIFSTPISEISMGHHPSQIQGKLVIPQKKKLDENKFPPINDPIQIELDNLAKSLEQQNHNKSTPISNLNNNNNNNNNNRGSIVDFQSNDDQSNLNDKFNNNNNDFTGDTLSDIGSQLDLDLSEFANSL